MKSPWYRVVLICFSLLAVMLYSGCGGERLDDPKPDKVEKDPPVIDAISPTIGIGGIPVTITGDNFSLKLSENIVTFNGAKAQIASATETQLVVLVPKNASSGPIAVQIGTNQTTGPSCKVYEVFVVGNDFPGDGNCVIRLWKNAAPEAITDGKSNTLSIDVGLLGDEIIIAGYRNIGGLAAYMWRNKVQSTLQENAFVEGMTTDGSNVYVLGKGFNSDLKYWKNGNEVIVPTPAPYTSSLVMDIAVRSGDVYLAGVVFTSDNKRVPLYWKNGTENFLTHNIENSISIADITVDGSDIYVLGSTLIGDINRPQYWKNNEVNYLTDGTVSTYASEIVLYDGDIYIGGSEKVNGRLRPRIWKNGTKMDFTWMDMAENAGFDIGFRSMSILDGNVIYMGSKKNVSTFKEVPYVSINDNVAILSGEGQPTQGMGMVAR